MTVAVRQAAPTLAALTDGSGDGVTVEILAGDDLIVVKVDGTLDGTLPNALLDAFEQSPATPQIIDLSRATLRCRDAMVGLAGLIAGTNTDEFCFVCDRGTGRRLLRTWGVTRCAAVFTSVRDALQARRFLADGYGTGWRPDVGPAAKV